jgi:hypothetical protein
MNTMLRLSILAGAAIIGAGWGAAQAQQANMTFFITSHGPGKGGDLGGIAGADAHCQALAASVGAGSKTWRAYLSSNTPANGQPAVNARDRIGSGPWQNAKGVVVAKDVNDLHANANINKDTALDEKGERIKVRGDTPNQHDMLTGSTLEGRAFAANLNLTCNNWSSSNFGTAMVGHVDREGIADTVYQHSWVSSHQTPTCTPQGFAQVGGGGLFYCFAQ